MKSNINKNILKLIDEVDKKKKKKEYLLKALELEYNHSSMKRPRLDDHYKNFVEEFSGKHED